MAWKVNTLFGPHASPYAPTLQGRKRILALPPPYPISPILPITLITPISPITPIHPSNPTDPSHPAS